MVANRMSFHRHEHRSAVMSNALSTLHVYNACSAGTGVGELPALIP